MTANDLANRVNAKRVGHEYRVRCPAHPDEDPSLDFRDGDKGIVFTCRSRGCSHDAILNAWGLAPADVFQEVQRPVARRRIVQTYQYRNKDGALQFEVVRYEPKDFRPRRRDANGGWIYNLEGVPRLLYRLPDLVGHATVYWCEGEKDVDNVWNDWSLPATTIAGGAGAPWLAEYGHQLAAAGVKTVIVCPDQDEAGARYGDRVANGCRAAGLVVKTVCLPGLPDKGDVTDFIEFHDKSEFLALVESAPLFRPDSDAVSGRTLEIGVATESELPFRTAAALADLAPETVEWIVPGFVAPGVITEIDGKLKASGKTTFLAQLVRAVLTGDVFLGRATSTTPVVWLTEERPQTFLQSLKRAGLETRTDLHVLHWHDAKHLAWPATMTRVIAKAQALGARLVITDTISQWAGLRGDSENDNGAQLQAAAPLQDAAAAGLGLVVARHERKGGGEVGESGRGGSAFSGAVDIVISLRRGEGKTKPTVRVLHTLSRFSETPDSLVIDLTDRGYVVLGDQATVATLEAERALLDRLPAAEDEALDLESLRLGDPVVGRTVAKVAIKNLFDAGKARRLGSGKKGDAYRFFRTVNDSVATQTYRSDQKPASFEVANVGRF